jgi:aminoglycoside phosphotransferase (APT) family kinase protein
VAQASRIKHHIVLNCFANCYIMEELVVQDPAPFLPLLDHLGRSTAAVDGQWREWRIARVAGAGNNLIFRASSATHDLAIKFTIRDPRDRAGREYNALLALRQAGLMIAPVPLWLDRDSYAQPVIVQSWLEGTVLRAPPAGDGEWQRLLDHYLSIHTLTPAVCSITLLPAAMNMTSAADGLDRIRQQLAIIPVAEQPPALHELTRYAEAARLPDWPAPPLALCRTDPNTLNFVRRPSAWASVDWENAGWGDPAFEIADLATHPAYADVPPERSEWLIDSYSAQCGDPYAATRMRVYRTLMLIWWVARLARTLYEVPRGGDQRLIARPDGWLDEMRAKYAGYLALARSALAAPAD